MLMIAIALFVVAFSANSVSAAYGMARPADPIPATSWQIYTIRDVNDITKNWLQVFKTNNIADGECWSDFAFVKNEAGMPISNYHGACTK